MALAWFTRDVALSRWCTGYFLALLSRDVFMAALCTKLHQFGVRQAERKRGSDAWKLSCSVDVCLDVQHDTIDMLGALHGYDTATKINYI